MPVMQRTPYLLLPQFFDPAALQDELHGLQLFSWQQHYNTQSYQGDWRCLPLRSVDGNIQNILAQDQARFLDTPALESCPAIQKVMDTFCCEKTSVRLMSLAAGASILPHRDQGGGMEDGVARLHIPIVTHPKVLFFIEGEPVHLAAGQTWYLNANCEHAVINGGPSDRVHLVIDCVPNAWLMALFERSGWKMNDLPYYGDRNISDENVEEIISALLESKNETSRKMADKLTTLRNLRKTARGIAD